MSADRAGASVAALLSDALAHILAILRGEIALAKAEMRDNAAKIGGAVGLMAVAAVLGMVGLNTLAGAAVLALIAAGMTEVGAAVTVGFAVVGVAVILVLVARARLKTASLAPQRVASNLRKDAAVVTGGGTNV